MRPIVHGLEQQYGRAVHFVAVDAQDEDAGQAAFDRLKLPGHPAYVIVQPDGEEVWRGLGPQPVAVLEAALQEVLASDP